MRLRGVDALPVIINNEDTIEDLAVDGFEILDLNLALTLPA